jgi:hypothetical protein
MKKVIKIGMEKAIEDFTEEGRKIYEYLTGAYNLLADFNINRGVSLARWEGNFEDGELYKNVMDKVTIASRELAACLDFIEGIESKEEEE